MISELIPVAGTLPPISLTAKVAVIDFETYWSEDYSVAKMSYWHYCHDVRFDAYLVSIVTNDGFEWVGHPKDAPWERVRDYVWVSHNQPFDGSVHDRLQEDGIVPAWEPIYWGDSIALCAWIRVPRALAKAVNVLYGAKLAKNIRDKEIKNLRWSEFPATLQKRVCEYALEDGRWPLRIWMEHIHLWPDKERRLADLLAARGLYGLAADKPGMEADMEVMRRVVFNAEQKIPWATDPDEKILSAGACAKECRKHGIEPPPSLDMKDEGLQAWEDKYGDQYPFVAAMRDWRRMNGVLKKYETIYSRIKPNGRFEFPVSYLGTHTGRTSGTDKGTERKREGLNLLNLPRDPFYIDANWSVFYRKSDLKKIQDHCEAHKKNPVNTPSPLPEYVVHSIDLRAKIIPGPGMKFVICDKSQIEARVTNWFARDKETLDLIRKGYSVYDVHAIRMMGYVPEIINGKPVSLKKTDKMKYALAKARELALGYQSGHVMFLIMAPLYVSDEEFKGIFDKPYTDEQKTEYLEYLNYTKQRPLITQFANGDEYLKRTRIQAWIQVQDYRKKKPQLAHTKTGLWKKLDDELRRSASTSGSHEVELPSGRVLRYFDLQITKDGVEGTTERGGSRKKFYGGKVLANSVSATARDIFLEDQLRLDDAGILVVLDVYDEVIAEVPLDFNGQIVGDLMTVNPEWAKSLPIGVEWEESDFYKK